MANRGDLVALTHRRCGRVGDPRWYPQNEPKLVPRVAGRDIRVMGGAISCRGSTQAAMVKWAGEQMPGSGDEKAHQGVRKGRRRDDEARRRGIGEPARDGALIRPLTRERTATRSVSLEISAISAIGIATTV